MRDTGHQHRMHARVGAQPLDQLAHERRHLFWGWRRVDDFARAAVGDLVLDRAVTARLGGIAPHAVYQPLVDLADQPLGDGLAAAEVLRDQVERAAIVQQLADVVGICALDLLAGPQARGFVQRELCALDVRGVWWASSSSARWLMRSIRASDRVAASRKPWRSMAVSAIVIGVVIVKRRAKVGVATARPGRRGAGGKRRGRRTQPATVAAWLASPERERRRWRTPTVAPEEGVQAA